jgi:50S ribosomal subunit-associated GTPase HflX
VAAADLCVWVLDGSTVPVWPSANLGKTVLVINKCDLPSEWATPAGADAVQVSAKTGAGVPLLCQRIAAALVPEVPPPGTAVPFNTKLAVHLAGFCGLAGNVETKTAVALLDRMAKDGGESD